MVGQEQKQEARENFPWKQGLLLGESIDGTIGTTTSGLDESRTRKLAADK